MNKPLLALIVAVELLIAVPPALNGILVRAPESPKHMVHYEEDDAIYSNYLHQAIVEHRLLFVDRFTSERGIPVLNILWLFVGLLGRFLHLATWQAQTLGRMIFAPILILILHAIGKRASPERPMAVTLFVLFFSGIGWLEVISGLQPNNRVIDFFIPESTFLNVLTSPAHIIASYSCMVGSLWLFFRWRETLKHKYLYGAALLAALLMQFHPYHLLTLALISFVWLIFTRKKLIDDALGYGIYLLAMMPGVLYHMLLQFDPVQHARYSQNITLSPSLIVNLVALMFPLGFAVLGAWRSREQKLSQFLALWLFVALFLVHSSLPTNIRFIAGAFLPLGLLAFQGVIEVGKWLETRPRLNAFRISIAMFFGFWLFAGGMHPLFVVTKLQAIDSLSADTTAVIDHLRVAPLGVVFAPVAISLPLAADTSQRVYIGWRGETVGFYGKIMKAQSFVNDPAHADLAGTGITYAVLEAKSVCFPGFKERAVFGALKVCEWN